MTKKSACAITVTDGNHEIGIGRRVVRDGPPMLQGGELSPDPWRPWVIVPIVIDGVEVIALHLDAAERFARALLAEVTSVR